VIVAVGIDVDQTFSHFVASALGLGVPVEVLNLRAVVEGEWLVPIPPDMPAQFWYMTHISELHPSDSYFSRIINLSSERDSLESTRRWAALTEAIIIWLEQVPGRVVNPPQAGTHNGAKPLHEAILARLGFRVPASITSCEIEKLREFVQAGPTVSKALSGVRADTVMVDEDALADFDAASGPIHLQRYVAGDDARVHVVGDRLIAQRVPAGGGVDYRRDSRMAELKSLELPRGLAELLVRSSVELGLPFSGWDFKIDPDGEYWCLEVNAMPGYAPYDLRCEGAISRALLTYLEGKKLT
jgi:glutathione synthase/RimK-type ligase-like ATP-grasp enzyme